MGIVNKIVFFVVIFLSACASKWEVPKIQTFGEKTFSLTCDSKNYILQVNDEPSFALFDGLFVLVVSRKLENNTFKNTKFLPPNTKFDETFIKILEMIKENKKVQLIKSKNLVCEAREM